MSIKSKIPLNNLDAELAVLGAILINNTSLDKVIDILSWDDFYKTSHRLMFRGMLRLYEKSETIDLVTLSEILRQSNDLERCGGVDYLSVVVDSISTSAGIKYHSNIIRDLAIRRNLILRCHDIINNCYDKTIETSELLEVSEKKIFEVAERKNRDGPVGMDVVVKESFKMIEEVAENDSLITGIPTGFYDLDRMTAGWQPGDLIILAGRPSMGKTALVINMVENAVKATGKAALVYSLEMGRQSLGIRMIGSNSKVSASKIRVGNLKDEHWQAISDSANELASLPIYIDDSSDTKVLDMKADCRRLIKQGVDLGMLVIDYIGLVRCSGQESRRLEISEISRTSKALAKEFKIPVIALSQLNRKVEERPDKRPKMSDLRESGDVEADADIIAFVYRDEYYNPTNENSKNMAEVIIAKQRNGATGKVDLLFHKETTTFENYIKE